MIKSLFLLFLNSRARNDKGHYIKDDPDTPENEAWTTKIVKKVKSTKKA